MSERTLGDVLGLNGQEWRNLTERGRDGILLRIAIDEDVPLLGVAVQQSLANDRIRVTVQDPVDMGGCAVAVVANYGGIAALWLNSGATLAAIVERLPGALDAAKDVRYYGPAPAPCEPWCESGDKSTSDHRCVVERLTGGGIDEDPRAVRLEHYRNELGQFIPESPASLMLTGFDWEEDLTADQARDVAGIVVELAGLLDLSHTAADRVEPATP